MNLPKGKPASENGRVQMAVKDPVRIMEIGDQLMDQLTACRFCPHECGVNRTAGQTGRCGVSDKPRVASVNLHFGEEPPISGCRGSGTIFFSGCSLNCCYCQNYPISQHLVGSEISIEELAGQMMTLQRRRAHNINLVTPDHFFGPIVRAIGLAVEQGLDIPIVCNCSGWQKLETLRLLRGIFDIYLVDMRYSDNDIARNCSGAEKYKEINRAAVKEMLEQVGNLVLEPDGTARRGVIIRHLVLPGGFSGSAEIFGFLAEEISKDIYVSLMSQYFPAYRAVGHSELGRPITPSEFDKVVKMFYNAGLKNGYIQKIGPGSA